MVNVILIKVNLLENEDQNNRLHATMILIHYLFENVQISTGKCLSIFQTSLILTLKLNYYKIQDKLC